MLNMPIKSKKKKREYNQWRYRELKKGSWSTSRKSKYKLWTKNDIKKVLTLWDSHTIAEMCEILDRKKGQIMYMATEIRKSGHPLTKKMSRHTLRGLIKVAIKEYKKDAL